MRWSEGRQHTQAISNFPNELSGNGQLAWGSEKMGVQKCRSRTC